MEDNRNKNLCQGIIKIVINASITVSVYFMNDFSAPLFPCGIETNEDTDREVSAKKRS